MDRPNLSSEERDRLQAKANRLKLSPDVEQLDQAPVPIKALAAFTQLQQIAKQMSSIDVIKSARDSREDIEHRSVF
jgi:hypothetical protein